MRAWSRLGYTSDALLMPIGPGISDTPFMHIRDASWVRQGCIRGARKPLASATPDANTIVASATADAGKPMVAASFDVRNTLASRLLMCANSGPDCL